MCVCVPSCLRVSILVGMEALCVHILDMMSLISETLMSIKGLEYAAFGIMSKKLCKFSAPIMDIVV